MFLNPEPILLYIIDNTTLGCIDYGGHDSTPYRAYNILLHMFSNSLTKVVFPKQLQQFFMKKQEILTKTVSNCLVGWKDSFGDAFCFNLSVSVHEKRLLPVLLHSFSFAGIAPSLKKEVSLSSEDAFYIFANICANCRIHHYWSYFVKNPDTSLSDYLNHPSELARLKHLGADAAITDYFINSYLQFIQQQLDTGQILPVRLLQLSGSQVLSLFSHSQSVLKFIANCLEQLRNHSEMSLNEKRVTYCFIQTFYYQQPHIPTILTEFFEKNKSLMEDIWHSIRKEFQ